MGSDNSLVRYLANKLNFGKPSMKKASIRIFLIVASFVLIAGSNAYADDNAKARKAYFHSIYLFNPIDNSKTKVSAIEEGRVYSHYSEVLKRRVLSIATSNPIFDIDQKPFVQHLFKDMPEIPETKLSNDIRLHWWELGIHSVLSGDFFGLSSERRFKIKVEYTNKVITRVYWQELESTAENNVPVIIRAFDNTGGSENVDANGMSEKGNGHFGWVQKQYPTNADLQWVRVPQIYNTTLGKMILHDDFDKKELSFVSILGAHYVLLANGEVFEVAYGSVVPADLLLGQDNSHNKFQIMLDETGQYHFNPVSDDTKTHIQLANQPSYIYKNINNQYAVALDGVEEPVEVVSNKKSDLSWLKRFSELGSESGGSGKPTFRIHELEHPKTRFPATELDGECCRDRDSGRYREGRSRAPMTRFPETELNGGR